MPKHYSFNLGLLRALCVMYRSPRRARNRGIFEWPAEANGAIVAGFTCATGTAKLMMPSTLRNVVLATLLDVVAIWSTISGPA